MGIGARSPVWRKVLFRAFDSTYVRRCCRTPDGLFEAYVSGNSSLRVLARRVSVDPSHQRFIDRWVSPDSVVWDIGANLGLFAFPAALKACRGTVYVFEPDVELAANFLRSSRLPTNAGLNVALLCLAVSDNDGSAVFQISKFSRAMNKLEAVGEWNAVTALESRPVGTLTVDTLAQSLAPPSIMKIDVEGAEMKVLEGADRTIAEYRPVILIEGSSELWEPMAHFFRRQRYVMLDAALDDPAPLDHPVWDTLAVPREKMQLRGSAGASL